MNKVASFTINHEDLLRGIYISRKDYCNKECITTFDIRMKEPNREPVMNTGEVHTIEHIGATFLRNDPDFADEIIYFGPMGCRTGFYLVMKGDLFPQDILELITNMTRFMAEYEGEVPAAHPRECGNYLDQNLPMAKYESKKYLEEVLLKMTEANMVYPE